MAKGDNSKGKEPADPPTDDEGPDPATQAMAAAAVAAITKVRKDMEQKQAYKPPVGPELLPQAKAGAASQAAVINSAHGDLTKLQDILQGDLPDNDKIAACLPLLEEGESGS